MVLHGHTVYMVYMVSALLGKCVATQVECAGLAMLQTVMLQTAMTQTVMTQTAMLQTVVLQTADMWGTAPGLCMLHQ